MVYVHPRSTGALNYQSSVCADGTLEPGELIAVSAGDGATFSAAPADDREEVLGITIGLADPAEVGEFADAHPASSSRSRPPHRKALGVESMVLVGSVLGIDGPPETSPNTPCQVFILGLGRNKVVEHGVPSNYSVVIHVLSGMGYIMGKPLWPRRCYPLESGASGQGIRIRAATDEEIQLELTNRERTHTEEPGFDEDLVVLVVCAQEMTEGYEEYGGVVARNRDALYALLNKD